MSVLEESLMNMVRTSRLWQEGGTVITACSGGADSLTLTDIMAKAAEEDDVTVLVAHVHHHLRGEEADEDARFVSAFCKDRDLSYTQFDIDPQALKEKEGLSLKMQPGVCAMRHLKPTVKSRGPRNFCSPS